MMRLPTFTRHLKREILAYKMSHLQVTKPDNVPASERSSISEWVSRVEISVSLRTNKWFVVLTNATKDMFTIAPVLK